MAHLLSAERMRSSTGDRHLWLFDWIAEEHFCQAIDHGELDDLSGAGKSLVLDDDSVVPELRAGYRLLKNAGYEPPETEALREIRNLQVVLTRVVDVQERDVGIRRLRLLETYISELHGRGISAGAWQEYRDQLQASPEKARAEHGSEALTFQVNA